MQWDLGLRGVAVLAALSLGFGVVAGLLVGRRWALRGWAVATATISCFLVGLFTSEAMFGWAPEEDLQPNIDGLSFDEVLLASAITTTLVVVGLRRVRHHKGSHERGRPRGV